MKPKVMLSTCGTSILTNQARWSSTNFGRIIIENSNNENLSDISSDDIEKIKEVIGDAEKGLKQADTDKASEYSAELAGILAYYKGDLSKAKQDIHYLLATDTWLGKVTAELTKEWLEQNGLNVQVYRQADLQTADWKRFSSSLADLVKWCHQTFEPYQKSHEIVFNLSGGFKSETGFLQVLGMFYADETFYIYERSTELVKIPKLPVRMDDIDGIVKDLTDIRRASKGLSVNEAKDGIYWFSIENEYALTPWGELVFNAHKKKIYSQEINPSISTKVILEKSFLDDCKKYAKMQYNEVNNKIDMLARMQEFSESPKSLDFKTLKAGEHMGCTHECDAWHSGSAFRIYCVLDGDKVVLKHLGKALH